jgi:hypothetical protein
VAKAQGKPRQSSGRPETYGERVRRRIVMTDNRTNDQERDEISPLGEDAIVEDLTPGEELEAEEQTVTIETADEALEYITSWANRGNMKQFYTEVSARLSDDNEHDVDLDGDTLTFYNVRQEGGILGIGAETVREPALRLVSEGGMIRISDDPMDPDCALAVAQVLSRH